MPPRTVRISTLARGEVRRVLLVRPDRLGDLVLSLPAAAALRELHGPGVKVDFLASSYNAAILRFSPDVSGHLLFTTVDGAPRPVGELSGDLAAARYDAAVFLKPEGRAAVAAFLARVPVRVGTRRRLVSVLFNHHVSGSRRTSGQHEADLNVDMLRPFGYTGVAADPRLVIDPGEAKMLRTAFRLPERYLAIHFGSGGSAANWPRTRYEELAAVLVDSGFNIAVTGQTSGAKLPESVIDLGGRTTLDQLAAVLAGAESMVAGSTGPLHIAAALGVPALGLYPDHRYHGPQRWGPRGPAVAVLKPRSGVHSCVLDPDGSCSCMLDITVEDVSDALTGLMTQGRARTAAPRGASA
ncbi:MAG: glycosyltransferase family 9 protein [Gemmatimonadota bacterium]